MHAPAEISVDGRGLAERCLSAEAGQPMVAGIGKALPQEIFIGIGQTPDCVLHLLLSLVTARSILGSPYSFRQRFYDCSETLIWRQTSPIARPCCMGKVS